jgi:hypothetical protein
MPRKRCRHRLAAAHPQAHVARFFRTPNSSRMRRTTGVVHSKFRHLSLEILSLCICMYICVYYTSHVPDDKTNQHRTLTQFGHVPHREIHGQASVHDTVCYEHKMHLATHWASECCWSEDKTCDHQSGSAAAAYFRASATLLLHEDTSFSLHTVLFRAILLTHVICCRYFM